MEMNLDPIDFFPGYDPYYCRRPRRGFGLAAICTHILAMGFAVGICAGVFFYYERYYYIQMEFEGSADHAKSPVRKVNNTINIDEIKKEMDKLKDNMEKTNIWRKHLDELFTKIYVQQDRGIEEKVSRALDLYDADKVGLFDYASVYACATVVSTPDTYPYPANKTISFFNLLNVDLLSNPENVLQPGNLPGNCFAFYGTTGRIRIKLGSKIGIKAVTLDHITLMEDASSAPKEFEVFGLTDPDDVVGVSLGKFVYKLGGRPYQTFKVDSSSSHVQFRFVELFILNNHGRRDFTCVYRFRVHNTVMKNLSKY